MERTKKEIDMDYEQKYKEALERFKTFREKYCTYGELHFGDVIFDKTGEAQKDLDAIFPELTESEDERMIKAIEHILYENYSDAAVIEGVEIAEIVTWLEKPKEPIDPFDTKLFQDGVKEGRRLEREDIMKERQPAEWSEDKFPKDIEKDATQFCFDKGVNITPYQAKEIATHYLMIGHNFGYVEGRKNAHIPAKELGLPSSMDFKQEWSKEDNIGWDEAFACVTRAEKAAKNEEELQNAVTAEKWLKEIKFKYYVHPVKQEWSEEDEYRIRQIERIAQQAGCTQKLQEEIHDWLKSLRSRPKPSDNWKPSDEQREAAPKTCLKGIFDFDDISQLELAANCYKEKKGCAYPVTVEHQHEVLMKLYDLIGVDREALDQDKEDETKQTI